MKAFYKILLVISIFVLALGLFVSCQGNAEKKDEKTNSNPLNLPDWFLTPPIKTDVIYATGFSKKANLQLALDTASDFARQEISRVIGVKVNTMTKQFLEEAGVDNKNQLTEFSSVVSKSISSNMISGSKIKERVVRQNASGQYEAFVLIENSLTDMSGAIESAMKSNNAAFAELKAKKSFDELSKELTKLESKDFEKPTKPTVE